MAIINRTIASAIVLGGYVSLQGAAFAQSATIAPTLAATMATATPVKIRIPEGTEVRLKLLEKLSSSTSAEGDTFEVVTADEIDLPDGSVIPPGYPGLGEVTHAEHNGWVGKSGQLDIRIDYMKIDGTRVHLRGNKGREGDSNTGNLIAATVLFGLVGLAVHGHSVVYPAGTLLTAYVDTDADLPLSAAASTRVQVQQPAPAAKKPCLITSPTGPSAITCN
jgi:hypothetical protein